MARKTKATLLSEMQTALADNIVGAISEQDVRDRFSDLYDSIPLLGDMFVASDATGATDVTSELQTLVNAADGDAIFIPEGTYLINNLVPPENGMHLWAHQGTVTFKYDSGSRCIFKQFCPEEFYQVVSAVDYIDNPYGETRTRLTVADASAFNHGDQVVINCSDSIGDQTFNTGEGFNILGIDTVNNYVWADRALAFEDIYATNIYIVKMKQSHFIMNGINFQANGDHLDTAITSRSDCIELRGQPNVYIDNCNFTKTWRAAITIWTGHTGQISNCRFEDLPNIEAPSGTLIVGYGVNIMGSSTHLVVKDCFGRRLRHTVATGAQTGATFAIGNWEYQGVPTYCLFQGLVSVANYAASYDMHEGSKHCIYKDCTSITPNEGPSVKDSEGTGIGIRSMDCIIENFTQYGGHNGIVFLNDANFGYKARHQIRGATIRGLNTDTGFDTAIYIGNGVDATFANNTKFIAQDIVIEQCGRPLYFRTMSDVEMRNVYIADMKFPCAIESGAQVLLHDLTLDFFETRYQYQHSGITLRSDAGETTRIVLTGTTRVRVDNDGNNPDYFLQALDSTGTKEYYVENFVLEDYRGTSTGVLRNENATWSWIGDYNEYKPLTGFNTIYQSATAVGNVGTGEDNLHLATFRNGLLHYAGQSVTYKAAGTFANNADAKTLKAYATSTQLFSESLTTSLAGAWDVEVTIVWVSTNVQKYFYKATFQTGASTFVTKCGNGDLTLDDQPVSPSATDTNGIKLTGEATTNDDIVSEYAYMTLNN